MARSDPTDFVIEVAEGPRAGEVIALTGRSLPYRSGQGGSIEFGGEQRTKLIWYPGNPVATHLVFGQTLAPTTINGIWKERYLGTDEPIRLVELFEDLRMSGAQVVVTWETILRTGLVKKFVWKPGDPVGGLTDIAWECVFEWNGDGRVLPKKVGSASGTGRDLISRLAGLLGSARGAADVFSATYDTLRSALSGLFKSEADDIRALGDSMDGAYNSLVVAASRGASAELMPLRFAQDALSASGRAQESAAQLADLFGNMPTGVAVASDDVPTQMEFELRRYAEIERDFLVIEAAFDTQIQLQSVVRPDTYRRVRPPRGSDLRALALTYFGSADLWRHIAAANGLSASRIPNDVDEILVPIGTPDALDLTVVGAG